MRSIPLLLLLLSVICWCISGFSTGPSSSHSSCARTTATRNSFRTSPMSSRRISSSPSSLPHRQQQTANDDEEAAPMQQYSFMTELSTAIGIWFVGSCFATPALMANAAGADYTNTLDVCTGGAASSLLLATDDDNGVSVSNYVRQVFSSPLVGTTPGMPTQPIPTDPKYDSREARNRAYDEAFQQDARDRDAYYGQMAMRKRQESNQNVQQYRETLGLDGSGDVRMRVGEERVQGMASLRELKADYLSSHQRQQDDSSQNASETPAEN